MIKICFFFFYVRHEPTPRCHAITLTGSYLYNMCTCRRVRRCYVLDLTCHRSREIFRIKSNRRGRRLTCPVKRDRRSRPNDGRPLSNRCDCNASTIIYDIGNIGTYLSALESLGVRNNTKTNPSMFILYVLKPI